MQPKNPETPNQASNAAQDAYDILNFTITPSNGRGLNRIADSDVQRKAAKVAQLQAAVPHNQQNPRELVK